MRGQDGTIRGTVKVKGTLSRSSKCTCIYCLGRFKLSVKINERLLWFCFPSLCNWSKKTRNSLATNHKFTRKRFPAVGAGFMFLLQVVIGSLCS